VIGMQKRTDTFLESRRMNRRETVLLVLSFFLLLGLLVTPFAMASSSSGGGLPYETWLTNLRNSLTGPVAFTLSLLGIIASGRVLIFGGELNAFVRTMIFIVLVIGFLVEAQNMMSSFFGQGALIGTAHDMITHTRV